MKLGTEEDGGVEGGPQLPEVNWSDAGVKQRFGDLRHELQAISSNDF
jgi:hypothetical protein